MWLALLLNGRFKCVGIPSVHDKIIFKQSKKQESVNEIACGPFGHRTPSAVVFATANANAANSHLYRYIYYHVYELQLHACVPDEKHTLHVASAVNVFTHPPLNWLHLRSVRRRVY